MYEFIEKIKFVKFYGLKDFMVNRILTRREKEKNKNKPKNRSIIRSLLGVIFNVLRDLFDRLIVPMSVLMSAFFGY